MTTPLRVLHVIASLSTVHGGTTSSVLQMIAGLEANGINCEVATSDDDGPGRRLSEDAPERQISGRHYFKKYADFYVWTPSMRWWLEAHVTNYDLVHIHGLFSHLNGLAGRICRKKCIPYIVTPHGMANLYGMQHKPWRKRISLALVERPLLNGAARIHLTSKGEDREFGAIAVATPVARIPLAVSAVPRGDAAGFYARHPETAGKRLAIFMGRLNPIKNLEAAIDVLALPGGTSFHLVVCGDGPVDYTASLKSRAELWDVADRITWLGFVSGPEKSDVLAAGDIYIQPSFSESFGIAAVEAVSAGLPVVLGKRVAIAEDLVEANLAVIVEPNSKELAAGMNNAADMISCNLDRERGLRFVEQHFSPAAIGAALATVYKEVCQPFRGQAT